MQLSIALYLLVNAVLQIIIGPIADKAGRRPVSALGPRALSAGDTWLHLCTNVRGVPTFPDVSGRRGGRDGPQPGRGSGHV